MGSTVCVRCGATLIPHSYCDVCQDVLRFVCSSCSMYTDERIHTYCRSTRIQNNYDIRKLVQIPNSSQIVLNDRYSYIQNQLSDEIKYNSLNLLTSYWDSIFESIKLVNRYWRRIFNIGNSSS
jgi:predicted amidophosphoribosyltransferase